MFENNMKSAVFFTAVLIFAFVFIFVIQGVEYGAVAPGDPDEEIAEVEEIDEEGEVFTASAEGYGGELTVEVEIANNRIIDVRVIDHSETDGLSDPALENVPADIVDSQNVDVDIASGATVTSEAIMDAVAKALDEAGFDPDADATSETDEVEESESRLLEGVAEGYGGDIVVEVELDAEGNIMAVNIVEHSETDGLSDPAIENVPAAIVESQSTNVDIESGATVTSEAIMEAVEKALEKDEKTTDSDETIDVTIDDSPRVIEGVAEGYGGDLVVEVEIIDSAIVDIRVIDHNETGGISDPAIEKIPAAIVDSQSLDVDIISGVTVTSEAIINAVTNALETDDFELTGDLDEGDQDFPKRLVGIGEGYGGDIIVEVHLDQDDEIKEINILDHNETDGFSDPAFEEIPAAIIDSQSTDVDIVTGVTMTSEGIIEAVNAALE